MVEKCGQAPKNNKNFPVDGMKRMLCREMGGTLWRLTDKAYLPGQRPEDEDDDPTGETGSAAEENTVWNDADDEVSKSRSRSK